MRLIRSIFTGLGVTTASGLEPAWSGGATNTLLRSITRVVITAIMAWQAVMVAVTVVSLRHHGWDLASVQLLIGVLGALAVRSRRPDRLWPALTMAMIVAGAWSYVASSSIDSALTFAACWQINFASFFAGLLILRRYVIWLVVVAAAGASATILLFLPHWGLQLPLSVVVTQVTIVLAIRLGVAALLRESTSVDRAVTNADEATLQNEALEQLGARLAEESRVLHDTAINTFAAIASASLGHAEATMVREQCARDVTLLEQLRGTETAAPKVSLMDVFEQPGLPAHRSGLEDAGLARINGLLSADVIIAIVGCVREAVNNATKHSGAEHVAVDVAAHEQELVIRVADNGLGFSRDFVQTRGIVASIEQRARQQGCTANLWSSPGVGTTVTLRVPLTPRASELSPMPDDRALARAAESARRRASTYWGIGVTAESIVLTLAGGTNEGFALWPMIVIMALAVGIAWLPAHRRVAVPLLIAATLVVFVLSARATSFGTVGATHWQALAAAGPFVLLLSVSGSRRWRVLAASSWAAVAFLLAITVAPQSITGAVIVVLAGLVGLGFSGVWAMFQGFMSRLSDLAATARRDEFQARLRGEQEAAAQMSYQRWTDAGLSEASELLRGIRDGLFDPGDDSTRSACDEEELYLRQLVLIDPGLVHLGTVFTPLLYLARERRVRLTLRLGDRDTHDADSASVIAEVVRAGILATSESGSLAATLFPVERGLQLTLTGADLNVPERFAGSSQLLHLGDVDVLEILFEATTRPNAQISGL
ncbi:sensor histidine kinase [Leucobacter sp. HY1908]